MGFIRKQFLDIIQWLEETHNTLVYRFPMQDQEIQNGAQLTVRPGQVAIFVDKGQIADVFGPGMYKLETANLPLLSNLQNWNYGFKSPFKADVFFINMKEFLGNKWGTANPVWIPDSQFGQVQIRAHGGYTFKIENPVKLLNNVAGVKSIYRLEDISVQLRQIIVNQFTDVVGSLHLTVAQIASNYNEIAAALKETLAVPFGELGLSINQFTISNIGLPEEIEKSLRELTHMNILSSVQGQNLSKIQLLKQLEIMQSATENPGVNSMLQSGMGMGMGMQTAEMMVNGIKQMNQEHHTQSPEPVQNQNLSIEMITCPKCQATIKKGSKFCSECGAKIEKREPSEVKKRFCSQCGTPAEPGVKFCSECGTKLD